MLNYLEFKLCALFLSLFILPEFGIETDQEDQNTGSTNGCGQPFTFL